MKEESFFSRNIIKVISIIQLLPAFFKLHFKALRHSRELKLSQNNLKMITDTDIILFSVMKNESHRLDYFIDYYRNLGVNHFIFVDNGSTDGFNNIVSQYSDISVFYTNASYKQSNFGMHWLNFLLRKYGSGHWCITCDPDEFLVYPKVGDRNLRDLTEYLSSRNQLSLFTPMIDMYSKKAIGSACCNPGQNPLEVCQYFDKYGYVKRYQESFRNIWCQGGVRRRVFYSEDPGSSPAINKYTLIQWKWYFAYVQSMHMAIPRRLNEMIGPRFTSGALLHFKFISALKEKVQDELEQKQHYNNSSEYIKYHDCINRELGFYNDLISVEYRSWKDLTRLGLMNRGEW